MRSDEEIKRAIELFEFGLENSKTEYSKTVVPGVMNTAIQVLQWVLGLNGGGKIGQLLKIIRGWLDDKADSVSPSKAKPAPSTLLPIDMMPLDTAYKLAPLMESQTMPVDERAEELEILRLNCHAIARRMHRMQQMIVAVGGLSMIFRSPELVAEFECLAIEYRSSQFLMDRYRRDMAGEPAVFWGVKASSTCAAIIIAAECLLRTFSDLVTIKQQGKQR